MADFEFQTRKVFIYPVFFVSSPNMSHRIEVFVLVLMLAIPVLGQFGPFGTGAGDPANGFDNGPANQGNYPSGFGAGSNAPGFEQGYGNAPSQGFGNRGFGFGGGFDFGVGGPNFSGFDSRNLVEAKIGSTILRATSGSRSQFKEMCLNDQQEELAATIFEAYQNNSSKVTEVCTRERERAASCDADKICNAFSQHEIPFPVFVKTAAAKAGITLTFPPTEDQIVQICKAMASTDIDREKKFQEERIQKDIERIKQTCQREKEFEQQREQQQQQWNQQQNQGGYGQPYGSQGGYPYQPPSNGQPYYPPGQQPPENGYPPQSPPPNDSGTPPSDSGAPPADTSGGESPPPSGDGGASTAGVIQNILNVIPFGWNGFFALNLQGFDQPPSGGGYNPMGPPPGGYPSGPQGSYPGGYPTGPGPNGPFGGDPYGGQGGYPQGSSGGYGPTGPGGYPNSGQGGYPGSDSGPFGINAGQGGMGGPGGFGGGPGMGPNFGPMGPGACDLSDSELIEQMKEFSGGMGPPEGIIDQMCAFEAQKRVAELEQISAQMELQAEGCFLQYSEYCDYKQEVADNCTELSSEENVRELVTDFVENRCQFIRLKERPQGEAKGFLKSALSLYKQSEENSVYGSEFEAVATDLSEKQQELEASKQKVGIFGVILGDSGHAEEIKRINSELDRKIEALGELEGEVDDSGKDAVQDAIADLETQKEKLDARAEAFQNPINIFGRLTNSGE